MRSRNKALNPKLLNCQLYKSSISSFIRILHSSVFQCPLIKILINVDCHHHLHRSAWWPLANKGRSPKISGKMWEFCKSRGGSGRGCLLVHCCTLSLCHVGSEIDDHHKNPNINTEILLMVASHTRWVIIINNMTTIINSS